MTEAQRIEDYKKNCREVAYDVFVSAGERAAHEYLDIRFRLLKLYELGDITLKQLNEAS